MCDPKDKEKAEAIEFRWGNKKGKGAASKNIQFYESFIYDGEEYVLYDCVYLYKKDEIEPYVGKLLKIWENGEKERKVKVLWFFRPCEISNYLQGVDVLDNELFMASGEGKGLFNVNPLEAIAGKCNVVCISKDSRNRQPSTQELEMAHFVFYRTFDVKNLTISEKLDEKIALVEVRFLLNKINLDLAEPPRLDNGVVTAEADVQKPASSVKDTLAADKLLGIDICTASLDVKGDKGPNVSGEVEGNVMCDGGIRSSSVEDDEGSFEKIHGSKPDNTGEVPLPALEQGSDFDPKFRCRSADADEVGKHAVNVSAAEDKKSEAANVVKRPNGGEGKAMSEDRPLKKLKADVTGQSSSGNGAVGTPISASASFASKKVLQPASAAREINGRGKLGREPGGVSKEINERGKLGRDPVSTSSHLSDQQKSNGVVGNKSDVKMQKTAVKQSTDLENPADKASQHPGAPAPCKDGGKLARGPNVTTNTISKKAKSNVLAEPNAKLRKVPMTQSKDEDFGKYGHVKEVTPRPSEKSKWFTASPWEDRLKDAHDQGRLVLLQNLDPTYSSSDVENIIWHAFGQNCQAQMVQRTATSSPRSGQAFAIFKAPEIALDVVRKLDCDCLMLPNGRPLVGTIGVVNLTRKQSQYFGHLIIDKLRQQMQRDLHTRDAVSTSHSSQANTLEYEMAIEWRLLQERSDLWWKNLHKEQGEDMRKLKASLKSK